MTTECPSIGTGGSHCDCWLDIEPRTCCWCGEPPKEEPDQPMPKKESNAPTCTVRYIARQGGYDEDPVVLNADNSGEALRIARKGALQRNGIRVLRKGAFKVWRQLVDDLTGHPLQERFVGEGAVD